MDERKFTGIPAPLGSEVAGIDRPLVQSDRDQLIGAIEAAIEDESGASPMYERIASTASELGFEEVATVFSNAADDERRHRREFKRVLENIRQ